jgi:hypothetical protein
MKIDATRLNLRAITGLSAAFAKAQKENVSRATPNHEDDVVDDQRMIRSAPTSHSPIMLTLTALPPLLPFPFLPSRLLAPAELCARRLGPLICHCITHLR